MSLAIARLLVVALLVAFLGFPLACKATPCSCALHPARAEADGICSRTEDPKACLLSYQVTTSQYNDIQDFLFDYIGPTDLRTVQEKVTTTPPHELGSPTDVVHDLAVLFAISMTPEHSDRFDQLLAFLKENQNTIGSAFSDRSLQLSTQTVKMSDAQAIVSYGCVDYQDFPRDIFSMVKTPFSQALTGCDDFFW